MILKTTLLRNEEEEVFFLDLTQVAAFVPCDDNPFTGEKRKPIVIFMVSGEQFTLMESFHLFRREWEAAIFAKNAVM